jgi:hypothetical protein
MGYYDDDQGTQGYSPHQYGSSRHEGARPRTNRPLRPTVDTSTMTDEELFNYRKGFRLNFGKYKGLTLNEIASVEEDGLQVGLTYLSWLNDQQANNDSPWPPLVEALETFLGHPQVAHDVEEALVAAQAARPRGRY